MAHCGFDKTFNGIYTTYWFPSMRKRVRDYIDNCLICITANASTHAKEGDLELVSTPTKPFKILHVDHFGPLQETEEGYRHILVVVETFTRFTWLFQTKTTSTRETCDNLRLLFNNFGVPTEIVSDRGTSFTSAEFEAFVESFKVKHRKVAVAAPWANGLVERVNRFLKTSLMKLCVTPQTWNNHLSTVQYVINNTVHSSIKTTPSIMLLGYDQRNHTDNDLKEVIEQLAKIESEVENNRQSSRELAVDATNKIRAYSKEYYDNKHKQPTRYQVGDYVMIRDLQAKTGESRKLKPNYKGPYIVAKVLNKNRFVVQDIPGFNMTSRPYNTILSPDKMKPWVKPPVQASD